jgi:putative transposase
MARGRQTFSAEFKAKVALEAIKGMKTINELAREYDLLPSGRTQKKSLFLQ